MSSMALSCKKNFNGVSVTDQTWLENTALECRIGMKMSTGRLSKCLKQKLIVMMILLYTALHMHSSLYVLYCRELQNWLSTAMWQPWEEP